jgi:hypothetical protein
MARSESDNGYTSFTRPAEQCRRLHREESGGQSRVEELVVGALPERTSVTTGLSRARTRGILGVRPPLGGEAGRAGLDSVADWRRMGVSSRAFSAVCGCSALWRFSDLRSALEASPFEKHGLSAGGRAGAGSNTLAR